MQIDIFSDVICPWCFIGKRKLESALAEAGVDDARIAWHAFQLNPDMPREGMDRRLYLETKFGGAEQADAFYTRIAEAGREVGIPFEFERIPRTPNTLDAHRLIHLAKPGTTQDRMKETLLRAYFIDGEDISDRDTLTRLGADAGVQPESGSLDAWLETDALLDAVRDEDRQARDMGISGVPFFIFDRRLALSGAQPVEVFLQVFERLSEEPEPAP